MTHVRSSPHYPQSNGLTESAVKSMKRLIQKTTRDGDLDVDSFQRALLEWRNTPNASGQSPAQALYGRPLTSFLFAHHSSFAPTWQQQAEDVDRRTAQQFAATANSYNKSARDLRNLSIGTTVDIQHPRTKLWSASGKIVAIGPNRILANRPDLVGTVPIWKPKPDVPPDDQKKPIRPDLSRSTPKNMIVNLPFACSLCSSVGIQVSSVSFGLISCTRPWRAVIQTKICIG